MKLIYIGFTADSVRLSRVFSDRVFPAFSRHILHLIHQLTDERFWCLLQAWKNSVLIWASPLTRQLPRLRDAVSCDYEFRKGRKLLFYPFVSFNRDLVHVIKSVRKTVSNIKSMTSICLLPIWVIYSWQTYFRAESSASWKAACGKVSMSVQQLTILYKLMASFRSTHTTNWRSQSILNGINKRWSNDVWQIGRISADVLITTHKATLYWNYKLQSIICRCQGKGV